MKPISLPSIKKLAKSCKGCACAASNKDVETLIKALEIQDAALKRICEFQHNHEPSVAAQNAMEARAEVAKLVSFGEGEG